MKFKITLKHHDITDQALREVTGYNQDPEEIERLLKKWVRYDEYVTLEIDTVAETIRVCESK